MTIDDFKALIEPVQAECEDGRYLFVYFSKEDDKYEGLFSDDLDAGDAMLIIDQLARYFEIDLEVMGMTSIRKQAA